MPFCAQFRKGADEAHTAGGERRLAGAESKRMPQVPAISLLLVQNESAAS
jgi:hypothetical protein